MPPVITRSVDFLSPEGATNSWDPQKQRIVPRHLQLAIRNDEEFVNFSSESLGDSDITLD